MNFQFNDCIIFDAILPDQICYQYYFTMQKSMVSDKSNNFVRTGKNLLDQSNAIPAPSFNFPLKQAHKNTEKDSLQKFQDQLSGLFNRKLSQRKKSHQYRGRNNKTVTEPSSNNSQVLALRQQISALKSNIDAQKQFKSMEDKLQKLLKDISSVHQNAKNKNRQSDYSSQQSHVPPQSPYSPHNQNYYQPPYIQPQVIYPPHYPQYQYPPPPYMQYPMQRTRRNRNKNFDDQFDDDEPRTRYSKTKPLQISQNQGSFNQKNRRERIRTKLRKYLFTVAFITFLKGQTTKMSRIRKNNLKKFWLEKFESQINHTKNWLLDAHKYMLSIVLEKKKLDFSFWNEPKKAIKSQKIKMIYQLLDISLKVTLKQTTTQKISVFSELLQTICRRNSFIPNKFWTAKEMDFICISEYWGFIRIDENGEKALILILLFIKMFVYNMLLQPYKFDPVNFPKDDKILLQNMFIIASIFYFLVKQIIDQYQANRSTQSHYNFGNWLKVKKQFIVQCSQPLVYHNAYPDDNEYISGLLQENIAVQFAKKDEQRWNKFKETLKQIINKLHEQMIGKSSLVKKNLKYKMYN